MKISILQNCFSCDEAVHCFDGWICKAMTNILSREKDPAGYWLVRNRYNCNGGPCNEDADDCPCWINSSLGMYGDYYIRIREESARRK